MLRMYKWDELGWIDGYLCGHLLYMSTGAKMMGMIVFRLLQFC